VSAPLLGCIADDFTGATDLANNLVRAGMRTVQAIGVPAAGTTIDADAVVVALKSRTIPAADAVAQSLDALRWLRAAGCEQFYFKYCSTFDSRRPATSVRSPTRCSTRCTARAAASRSSARRSPRTAGRSSGGTCSSATCCCRTAACATTR
jgi:hypothetical protein